MKRFDFKTMALRGKVNVQTGIFVLTAILATLYGCSQSERILVPPQFDLNPFGKIGVIEFSSNTDSDLRQHATQNFIQAVQSAQPGIRFLELGTQAQVLESVAFRQLDFEAIRSIGRKFGVDAVLVGHLDVSEMKPSVRVSSKLTSLRAEANVEATLRSKLFETESGAILWTHATSGQKEVVKLRLVNDGSIKFGMSVPQEKYRKLIKEVVYKNTRAFRSHYAYRKVRK